MSKKNKDMPAMPVVTSNGICANGLTKREMIAMHAMQGLSSLDVETTKIYIDALGLDDVGRVFAKMSVEFADALLAELDKLLMESGYDNNRAIS